MKRIFSLTIMPLAVALIGSLSFAQLVSAVDTTFNQRILPLDCVFETVNDGTGTLHYLTPEACGVIIVPPPSETGQNPSPVKNQKNSPLYFLQKTHASNSNGDNENTVVLTPSPSQKHTSGNPNKTESVSNLHLYLWLLLFISLILLLLLVLILLKRKKIHNTPE